MATEIDPNMPMATPPAGVTPDFHSMTSMQVELLIVYNVSFFIATVLLALRLYTGFFLTQKPGLDTPFIILSWLTSLAFLICIVMAFKVGFGRHMYDVTYSQMMGYLELLPAMAITYIWPPTLAKLAILCLYHRIHPATSFRIGVYVAAAAVLTPTIVYTILFAGPCNPSLGTNGNLTCLNNLGIAQAVTNIGTDVALIVMPIPMIISLQMPMKQKFTVGVLLVLGSFVVVFSIIRSIFLHSFVTDPDVTYRQASVAVWGCLELNFGIICNCAASLKPFLKRHTPWLARVLVGSSGRGMSGQNGAYQIRDYPPRESNLRTIGGSASNRSGSRPWRGDNQEDSVALRSFGRSTVVTASKPDGRGGLSANQAFGKNQNGVMVTDEYEVNFSREHSKGDTSSTEDILEHGAARGKMR